MRKDHHVGYHRNASWVLNKISTFLLVDIDLAVFYYHIYFSLIFEEIPKPNKRLHLHTYLINNWLNSGIV